MENILPRINNDTRFVGMVAMLVSLILLASDFYSLQRVQAQTADNAARDLRGENHGNAIWLRWENQAGTTEYIMYRSRSVNGPGKH